MKLTLFAARTLVIQAQQERDEHEAHRRELFTAIAAAVLAGKLSVEDAAEQYYAEYAEACDRLVRQAARDGFRNVTINTCDARQIDVPADAERAHRLRERWVAAARAAGFTVRDNVAACEVYITWA